MTGTVARLPRSLVSLGARRIARALAVAAITLVALPPMPARADNCSAAARCQFLTAQDAMDAVRAAATAISANSVVIAVVDRSGVPLAVYLGPTATAADIVVGNFGTPINAQDYAVGLARTGAFFSNNQAPLSSRTVRFISGIHFPPGVFNKPPAALYGIENTNRGCTFNLGANIANAFNPGQDIPRATSVVNGTTCQNTDTSGCGSGIVTGKRDIFDSDPRTVDGGGVPIFKRGQVVGGIGVTGVGIDKNVTEFAAFTGSIPGPGFGPPLPDPGAVILEGIRLPFVNNILRPPGVGPGVFNGAFTLGPIASPNGAAGVPSGYLVGGPSNPLGSAELGILEVRDVITRGVVAANDTRAAIRLPLGSSTSMVLAVSDLAGNILALYRMPDATIFSVDVAVAKARNAVYFSSRTRNPADLRGVPLGTAVTARTIGFGAMPLYPAGIDGTRPGPFFGDFVTDVTNPCTQGFQPGADNNRSGIVFFPGSMPLYRNGVVVGGLGVSGDGVEQDDFVTAAAIPPQLVPPLEVRADRVVIGEVRLPFLKFPRNPLVE
jgi:uncharacterized protein GlcG (DUF336 family)